MRDLILLFFLSISLSSRRFKKMLLTGAMTVIAAGSSMQLVIAMLVVLTNLLLTLKIGPFVDDADDFLAFLTSLQMLLTLLGGLLIKTDNPADPTYDKNMMGVILIFINSVGFFVLAMSLVSLHPKVRACLNSKQKKKKKGFNEQVSKGNTTKVVPLTRGSNNSNDSNTVQQPIQSTHHGNDENGTLESLRSWGQEERTQRRINIAQKTTATVTVANETTTIVAKKKTKERRAVTSRKQLRDIKMKYGSQSEEYKTALKQIGQQRKSTIMAQTQ